MSDVVARMLDPTASAQLAAHAAPRRALFLDRDGVLNVDHGYVHDQVNTDFLPGIFELVREANALGFVTVIVTNQAGIARGLYTEDTFRAYTRWVHATFADAGAPLLATFFCPHHPTAGQGELLRACACRKPAPGMLRQAQRELGIAMSDSALFGDKRSDLQAAVAAGVTTRVLLGTDGRAEPTDEAPEATARFRSLAEAVASPWWRARHAAVRHG